jgi:putative PIN family toxin of toxin-antitoxin system
MTPEGAAAPERVVCDCNVLFQAMVSASGPARAVVDAAAKKRVTLVLSDYVLRELEGVVARPHLVRRFGITAQGVADFMASLVLNGAMIDDVPHVFDLPRDPKDAHFVDLAVAADARLIVSRDNDLLSLGDLASAEGRDFAARFPGLEILTPPQLLARIAPVSGP